jgi:hypothetical protein
VAGRRTSRALLGLALALLAGTALTPPAHAANGQPLAWGAFPAPRSGETKEQAVRRLESLAGRKLDVVRAFYRWDEAWPTSYETWLKTTGHTMIMSVKARRSNGTPVKWADIAAAQPGSALYQDLVRWAQRVRDYGAPINVTFTHEPEASSNTDMGTATDFVAAWRKWVSVFRAQGATNAKYLWILTDYAFGLGSTDRRQAVKWYPGDAYVDGIGSDAYNWFTCRSGSAIGWLSLREILEPQRQFGLQHPGKELWVTEYGSVEDPATPGRKAQWYRDAQALFKTPEFAVYHGVSLYEFDSSVWTTCPFQPDSSPSAASAWTAWGQDPYYGGPGSTPPATRSAVLVVGNPAAMGSDATLVSRLTGLGFTVTVADDDTVTATGVSGASVVLISQTVAAATMGSKLRSVTRPVVTWKPAIYDDMGMTPAGANGAYGATTVSVTQPAHPLAAGRSGTVAVVTATAPLPWGDTAPTAAVVATVQGKPSLFTYPAGAQMSGLAAPACRIAIPLRSDTTPTANGWAFFDRAATWAADGCRAA